MSSERRSFIPCIVASSVLQRGSLGQKPMLFLGGRGKVWEPLEQTIIPRKLSPSQLLHVGDRTVAFMEPLPAGESESLALEGVFELTIRNAASLLQRICPR